MLLWLALLGGCSHDTVIGDFEIRSARLEGIKLTTGSVFGGPVEGTATLVVVDTNDAPTSLPVHVGGGLLGAVFQVTGDPIAGTTDIEVPSGSVADDVLRTFHGRTGGFVLVIGAEARTLTNSAGLRIDEVQFSMGAGIMAAYEWLRIRPADEVDSPSETGDTSDTGT